MPECRPDYEFDDAGSTKKDTELRKFTYDGENKQVKVETTNSGGTAIATNARIGDIYEVGARVKRACIVCTGCGGWGWIRRTLTINKPASFFS